MLQCGLQEGLSPISSTNQHCGHSATVIIISNPLSVEDILKYVENYIIYQSLTFAGHFVCIQHIVLRNERGLNKRNYLGELLSLVGQTHFAKCLTKLKRRTSPVAHVDQHVENPQELLGQRQRHGRVTMCEVLHQFRNARRNERSMPPL